MSVKPCIGCIYYICKPSLVYRGVVEGCCRQDWDGIEQGVSCKDSGAPKAFIKIRGKENK